jgi:hypothetical protein
MIKFSLSVISVLSIVLISCSCTRKPDRLFVGGFTMHGEKGMYVFDFNKRNGNLKLISQSEVGIFLLFREKESDLHIKRSDGVQR